MADAELVKAQAQGGEQGAKAYRAAQEALQAQRQSTVGDALQRAMGATGVGTPIERDVAAPTDRAIRDLTDNRQGYADWLGRTTAATDAYMERFGRAAQLQQSELQSRSGILDKANQRNSDNLAAQIELKRMEIEAQKAARAARGGGGGGGGGGRGGGGGMTDAAMGRAVQAAIGRISDTAVTRGAKLGADARTTAQGYRSAGGYEARQAGENRARAARGDERTRRNEQANDAMATRWAGMGGLDFARQQQARQAPPARQPAARSVNPGMAAGVAAPVGMARLASGAARRIGDIRTGISGALPALRGALNPPQRSGAQAPPRLSTERADAATANPAAFASQASRAMAQQLATQRAAEQAQRLAALGPDRSSQARISELAGAMDTEFEVANAYAPIRATDMQGMPSIPQAIRDVADPQVLQQIVEMDLLPELLASGADPEQIARVLNPALYNTAAEGQRKLRGLPTDAQERGEMERLQAASEDQAQAQQDAVAQQGEAQFERSKADFAQATGYDPERIASSTGIPVQTVMEIASSPEVDDMAMAAQDFLSQRPDAQKNEFVAHLRRQGVPPPIIEVLAALNGY